MSESYWALSDSTLRETLARVAAGEDPELVRLELYANSEIAHVEGEDS